MGGGDGGGDTGLAAGGGEGTAAAALALAAGAGSAALGSPVSPTSNRTAKTKKSPPPKAVNQSGVFGSSGTGSSCASATAEWASSPSGCAASSWAEE